MRAIPPKAIYLHVPFCERFCPYCHFVKVPLGRFDLNAYAEALVRELRHRLPTGSEPIKSLYLGGGTPSLLSPGHLLGIRQAITDKRPLSSRCEWTLEVNPNHATLEVLSQWRDLGINRLSLGVQSFDDQELSQLGRAHRGDEAMEVVRTAARAGFQRLSIDLLLGLAGQS